MRKPRRKTPGGNILAEVEQARGKRVPTSALESTVHPAALDAFEISLAPESTNRRIAWAGALSVGLHLVLLLTIGVAGVESMKPSSAPALRVYVESQPSLRDDDERDRSGPVEAPAAPASRPGQEELLSAAAPSRSSSMRSQPRPAAATAPPADTAASTTASQDESAESTSPSEEAAVVTTTGASESEAPGHAEPAAKQPGVDIPAAQQSMLSRWVMQAAQKLQDANLRQARLSLQHEGRQYVALLERRPAADSMDFERVTVEITTQENGKRLRTRLEMKRLAFSHFAQLVDQWDTGVQFHDDEIVGRFHSNSRINIGYDRRVAPRFLVVVTTAARGFTLATADGYRRNDEIFRGGFETQAGRIALPAKFSPPVPEQGSGSADVQSFSRDARITFYPDGSYGWREAGADSPEQRHVMSTPTYIVGARNTTLHVHGTVGGKVSVYSPERIVIEGSLIYAHDPRLTADADDFLGILSSKDVEIARPEVTGPGDLEIHAAVYARRRFVVTDEDAPRNGTLLIYGSLTAGSLSATEPRYATRYQFDRRFEHERPPGFPVTERYEIESWDPQWREAADQASVDPAESTSPPTG